jgi:hypothetical protein
MQYRILMALHSSSFKISNLGSDSAVVCAEQVVVAVFSIFLFDMYPFRISAALLVIQPEDSHDFPLYFHTMLFTHVILFKLLNYRLLNSIVDPDLIIFITEDQIVRFEVDRAMSIKITVFLTMTV